MVVGIIDHETGTRDIRRLGGLMNIMPITFTIAMIGALSMAGLPPFNGFLSKEMFFTGVLAASQIDVLWHGRPDNNILPVIAWVASVFTFIYCFVLLFRPFTGNYNQIDLPKQNVHEAPIGMLIPPIILAFFVVLIFFFPNVLGKQHPEPAFVSVMPSIPLEAVDIKISAWHGWNTELFMTIGVVLAGLLLISFD